MVQLYRGRRAKIGLKALNFSQFILGSGTDQDSKSPEATLKTIRVAGPAGLQGKACRAYAARAATHGFQLRGCHFERQATCCG